MRSFDYNEYLGLTGIQSGDIIDVSSGIASLKKFAEDNDSSFDADTLIDELVNIVGDKGTVMIRSFSWSFCRGVAFNVRETPSEVGALGTVALKKKGFTRTQHPIYSWMVSGYYQKELCDIDTIDVFDEKGIFSFFEKYSAKQLLIGKMQTAAFTMGHYIEVKVGVPFRKQKFFEADYCDLSGNLTHRRYSMFVKPLNVDVKYILSNYQLGQDDAMLSGIKKNFLFMDSLPISTIELVRLADFIRDDYLNNDGLSVVRINGVPGIKDSGVDWSKALF